MDESYYDWRSHVLANNDESEGFSLKQLLDIIPTDIPRDASEYDEELRQLIISLYSDACESDQAGGAGESKSLDTDFGESDTQKCVEGSPRGSPGGSTVSEGNVLVENRHYFNKMSKSLERSEINAKLSEVGCLANEREPDVNKEKNHRERPAVKAKGIKEIYSDVLGVATNSRFVFDSEIEETSMKESFDSVVGFDSYSDEDFPASSLQRYDHKELTIVHNKDEECLSKEITDNCHVQRGFDINQHANEVEDLRLVGKGKDESSHSLNMSRDDLDVIDNSQLSLEGKEKYQKNLDDLGDGKTATLLNSVAGWLTKISHDSSKDLLSAVSLLEDLPSGTVLQNGGEEVTQEMVGNEICSMTCDVEDKYSMPSEASKIKHPLTVIEEENDQMAYNESSEFGMYDCPSNVSSIHETLSHLDSGFGSLVALNQLTDIISSADENSNQTGPVISVDAIWESDRDSLCQEETLPGEAEPVCGSNADAIMLQFEEKFSHMGRADKNTTMQRALSLKGSGELEGQLKELSSDYGKLLQEKSALKKVIWELEENLSCEKKLAEVNQCEKFSIQNEKKEIEAVVSDLEEKLQRFETECNLRDSKLKDVVDKLHKINASHDSLKTQSTRTKEELKAKVDELEKSKLELSSYISACNTANESKEKCEIQLKLLSGAFQKLKQSKDWLEFQLKSLSDSRAKMQLEFEESKAEENSKSATVLKLQAENKNLCAKLVEVNFVSAKEKKEILSGMEKVEEEIMEHRTSFVQLEKRNEMLLLLLKEKDVVIETEETKVKDLIGILADAERRAEELRQEIIEKEKLLKVLRENFDSVEGKLEEFERMGKEDKEKTTLLSSRNAELEGNISDLKGSIRTKDEAFLSIVSEKESLENKLLTAGEEKLEFEKAVMLLKKDMQKVNLIFHVMKKDLESKSSMLEAIDAKKVELLKQMKDLQDYMSQQSQVQEELRGSLKEKIDIIREISHQKDSLAAEVEQLRDRCSSLQIQLNESMIERKAIKQEALDAESKWIEKEVEFKKEISSLVNTHDALVSENVEKEQSIIALKEESRNAVGDLERLKKVSQAEIVNLRAKENKLSGRLRAKQKEWLEKEKNYETNILSLVEKLNNESVARQSVDREVVKQTEILKIKDCQQKFIFAKVKEILKSFSCLKNEKEIIRNELLQFKNSSSKLHEFLVKIVNRLCKQIEDSASGNENLITEIESLTLGLSEKENSVKILQEQVKQERTRAESYESKLEAREVELRNLKKHVIVLKKDKDVGIMKLKQYKKNAESKMTEGGNINAEYRAQIESLKIENGLMLEKSATDDENISKLKDALKERDAKISDLEKSLSEVSQGERADQKEKAMLTAAYNELQAVIFGLENQLGIERSQANVLEDQIKSLKWQCKQATREAQVKREELDLVRSQHETEVQNMASLLSVAKAELICLREENAEVRKDKQKCSGRLIESKEHLRRQGFEHERLRNDVRKRNGELLRLKEDMKDCKSAATREMLDYIVKKAVIDISNDNEEKEDRKESREFMALKTLRKCMSGLRSEMDSLHSEMSSQMDYIQDSRFKIKEFQENLGGLQTACKSLHEKSLTNLSVNGT